MAETTKIEVSEARRGTEPPESYFVPATDIYETPGELVLVADMPGVRPEGLAVTVEENVLVIRGQSHRQEDAPGEPLLQEFATGEFYRAFQLPADFDTAKVQAALRQGVLTVRLPRPERMRPRRIQVKVE
jgi:HSP20 family protein